MIAYYEIDPGDDPASKGGRFSKIKQWGKNKQPAVDGVDPETETVEIVHETKQIVGGI